MCQSAADVLGAGPVHDIGVVDGGFLLEVAALVVLTHGRPEFELQSAHKWLS